jgi:hypothetical protein
MQSLSLVAIAAIVLLNTATSASAQSTALGTPQMQAQTPAPQIPPEVLRYIKEPVAESRQFDFLVGDWNVDATRYGDNGAPVLKYKALWSAMQLNGGRMIMDDFKALGPTGQPVSSFVTLRTYSEVTHRWELAGLQALQPSMPSEWHGVAKDGEMLLDATARTPSGDTVKTKIRFFNIEPDSFSWESAMSLDEGKSWRKTADLRATRIGSVNPAHRP